MDKAIGQTRGGLNTKLHTIVDGLGSPVEFMLPAGNDHDSVHAIELLEKVEISGRMYWLTVLMGQKPSELISQSREPAV